MKIALGTASKDKVKFLEEVLEEIGIKEKIKVFPIKCSSGISEQPLTEEETKMGSINRAKEAIKIIKEADFGVGIEIGYNKEENEKYFMFCYATLINKKGTHFCSVSDKLLLPNFHQEKINNKISICESVKKYYQDEEDLTKIYLGKMVDNRELLIKSAIRKAVIYCLLEKEFE